MARKRYSDEDALTNDLVSIFEDEFSQIGTGFKSASDSNVQIVSYNLLPDRPKFVSTLGLSNTSEATKAQFESFMEFSPTLPPNNPASVLDHFLSMHLAGDLDASKRGSYVLFPYEKDKVWKDDNSRGLYFTVPVCRSSKFQDRMQEVGVVPVWVVPITVYDSDILETKGWQALEDYWDAENIDLYTTFRK